jgi:putative membrane protein
MMGNGWGMDWMWLTWPIVILENDPSRGQEFLDERYDRGEITDEEYQKRLRHLRSEFGR